MIIELGSEDGRCAIDVSEGGRLSSLILNGRERLLGVPAQGVERSIARGSFVMAPFVGRLSGGEVTWNGRTAILPRNNGPHAIHGAVFDVRWQVTAQTPESVDLACAFDPRRWPFRGSMTQRIAIGRGRLTLAAEVLAEEPMPAAIGWHPWFANCGEDLRVGVASDRVLQLAPDLIPTGVIEPVDARTDLRARPAVGQRHLDDVFVAARSPAVVEWSDLELSLLFEDPVTSIVVFRHADGVCVEPATAWPDSMRLQVGGRNDTGLVSLGAGERLRASTTWSWSPRPAPPAGTETVQGESPTPSV
jgi:aldose 1-epimerase